MRKLLVGLLTLFLFSCNQKNEHIANAATLHQSMKKLSDVIVYDIFSPPVASRVYVYPSIAAYEAARHMDSSYLSLAGQLTGLAEFPQPQQGVEYAFDVAALHAFLRIATEFTFSVRKMEDYTQTLFESIEEGGISNVVLNRSVEFGDKIADHVLAWADKDNYKQTRSFPKYSITNDASKWKPTPPGYGEGIEPSWNQIRPFVIDSATQFIPLPPSEFSLDEDSDFYKETMEVYEVVKNATAEETEIASFWDCNPFALNVTGHVMHATKKISPGGHWIGITRIACEKTNSDFIKSSYAYALTSIALADGFISCWDEKYRSKLVRPETVINENIDPDWVPLLQTPPFPEHTSGHSVISRAAAIALTSIFGDNFAYEDDVELEYGLPIRKFNSFLHASEEAAISRLYGGIHYRPAIDYGVEQGEKVGKFVVENLKLRS
jgi:hypothetical protein